MTFNIGVRTRLHARAAPASFLALSADAAMAQSVRGTATYRERMALPPAAVFEATLEDVSRADAPADTVARTRVTSPGHPPIAFTIARESSREAHLQFQAGGRLTGSDGCDWITGSYQLKGDVVTFGQMACTQMACIDTGGIDRTFRDALKRAARRTVISFSR